MLSEIFQNGLIGVGLGVFVGKIVVRRAEQTQGELSPLRIRQLDFIWTCVGGVAGLFIGLITRLTSGS